MQYRWLRYLTMETISSCCPDEGLQPQIAGQGGVQRIHHVDILNISNKKTEYFKMLHRQGSRDVT
jgi:hypothetical protein